MVFSPVVASKSNGNSDRWINSYPLILNVAFSRARRLRYIVGDYEFFRSREQILGRIAEQYDRIQHKREVSNAVIAGELDTQYEKRLCEALLNCDSITERYRIRLKITEVPFTVDIGLVGPKRVAVECDGAHHEIVAGTPVTSDVRRDAYLRDRGWRVIRIPNYRIVSELGAVVGEIVYVADSSGWSVVGHCGCTLSDRPCCRHYRSTCRVIKRLSY